MTIARMVAGRDQQVVHCQPHETVRDAASRLAERRIGAMPVLEGGEVATNRLEDQEVSMLCLHLLQIALVYFNTLMIQRVLSEPGWMRKLTGEDLRALTPLIYAHVNPYGRFELDMATRLPLDAPAVLVA